MRNSLMTALVLASFSAANAHAAPDARTDGNIFSLTTGFNFDSGRYGVSNSGTAPTVSEYEAGPWTFKILVPSTQLSGVSTVSAARTGELSTTSAAGVDTKYGLADTLAAASYNIYSGAGSNFGIDLTGKVRLNATTPSLLNATQNDYAAQADAYQSFNRFTALGSLGYKVLGGSARPDMDGTIYGTFGGSYRLDDYMNGGVDVSLSQASFSGVGRRELSAYVSRKINKNLRAKGYVLTDFSNGTPDNSLGAQIYYGF